MNGKKFTASFSGGKDSTLAIYRAIKQGMIPISLINSFNVNKNRSWFHGITEDILADMSDSIGIPINIIKIEGKDYNEKFEQALKEEKSKGAEVCVFGDIDIEDHFSWCIERCNAVGIEAYFPLKNESRKDLVYEFINSGFTTEITVINLNQMCEKYLGCKLTYELAKSLEDEGVDICGENGEYHTFVSDGPIFKRKVNYSFGEKVILDNFAVMPILRKLVL